MCQIDCFGCQICIEYTLEDQYGPEWWDAIEDAGEEGPRKDMVQLLQVEEINQTSRGSRVAEGTDPE
jgi:hypothetical protein